MLKNVSIVVPVYNDWVTARTVLGRLNDMAAKIGAAVFVRLGNDGSSEAPEKALGDLSESTSLHGAETVHLPVHVGHQRAIAIGICLTAD